MTVFYVVQSLHYWYDLAAGPFQLGDMVDEPDCVGFLPVFRNRLAAAEWRSENCPDAPIVAIKPFGEDEGDVRG